MLRAALSATAALSALALAVPASGQTLRGALESGEVFGDARVRAERLTDSSLPESAEAVTARVRAGFVTGEFRRLSALIEAEATVVHGDTAPPGGAGWPYPSIGAAGNIELNRIQLSYDHDALYAALGRQILAFGDERYVGNEDWRQDDRTFDAIAAWYDIAPGLELAYAYVWRMNDTYGSAHLRSDSHLLNAEWTRSGALRLSAFAFLIDLPGAAQLSSATFGARARGALPAGPAVFDYDIAWARQVDHGAAAGNFALDDITASGGLAYGPASVSARFQRLEGDGVRGITYPFASRHGQRGWTDLFEHGPADGLRVWTLRGQMNFAAFRSLGFMRRLALEAAWHDYAAILGGGPRLGHEWNAAARLNFARSWSARLAWADFSGAAAGPPDQRRIWLELSWTP